jgi:regulator of cell morphogenesis and NO signaling
MTPGIDELCADIRCRHHAYLQRALPQLEARLALFGDQDAARFPPITDARVAFADLARQLQSHVAKEENLLFPALEALATADREGGQRPALPFSTILHPIRVMEAEHARIEAAIERLRAVTNGFTTQDDGPEAWRQCLAEFSRLERDLAEHLRLENEVLFPRALDLERRFVS